PARAGRAILRSGVRHQSGGRLDAVRARRGAHARGDPPARARGCARDARHRARAGAAQVRTAEPQDAQGGSLWSRDGRRRGRPAVSPVTERYVGVARVGDIPEGGVRVVRIEDQSIAVFHVEGRYYAIDDVCTHDGGPLAEGFIEGTVIE